MRKIFITLSFFIGIQLFGQEEIYYCENIWKEALLDYDIQDTLLVINNPTIYTKWENELLLGLGRTIVFIFKKESKWYSAYIMLTLENGKYVWYQSLPLEFSYNLQEQFLPSLFDSCTSNINDMIEYNKVNRINSGSLIFLFLKINDEIIEVYFQPKGRQDITALYGSQFSSIYTMYSLGLSNSMSLHYPKRKECESEGVKKKKKKKR